MLSGCDIKVKEPSEEAEELRHTYFVQCMELSAKIERKGDDDVSDIISECSTQAFYQTNYLR